MSKELAEHIRRLTGAEPAAAVEASQRFTPMHARKKQDLLVEGKHCLLKYFVVRGCLRLFFLDDKGAEQTIQFALENWWMSDTDSFNSGRLSEFNIQAIEDTEMMVIDRTELARLVDDFPFMESYFRKIYERAYAASLRRVRFIFQLSKEDFYDHFAGLYPDFMQRIPQKILASFLGFTPEYLSAMRKKKQQAKSK